MAEIYIMMAKTNKNCKNDEAEILSVSVNRKFIFGWKSFVFLDFKLTYVTFF